MKTNMFFTLCTRGINWQNEKCFAIGDIDGWMDGWIHFLPSEQPYWSYDNKQMVYNNDIMEATITLGFLLPCFRFCLLDLMGLSNLESELPAGHCW